MKPKFSTLIILTFICVVLLAPFALSPLYIPKLRESAFDLHLLLQGNIYKQITGYVSLVFVILEVIFTARKRGRGWLVKVTLPGSIQLWRSLHIFLGVGLLGTTLIHTIGTTGVNFNAIFLWVFFGVTLSALVGVVAETGIVESPQRYFSVVPAQLGKTAKGGILAKVTGVPKGQMIRSLRSIWLTSHIILVNAFVIMLGFHIFLTYYYE